MERSGAISNRWIILPVLVIGIIVLAFGLWMSIKSGPVPGKKQPESPEITTLKAELLKLKGEIGLLKNEMISLREEHKVFEDRAKVLQGQVTALKDELAGLAKRRDHLGVKKPAPKVINYKITKGDTLASIAKKFRVRPDDLRRWNHLPAKGRLNPGQTLTIHSLTP